MLSTIWPRLAVLYRRVRKKTLCDPVRNSVLSMPKNIAVGWVIFTVPLRKSVSQAVIPDIMRAKMEMVVVIISFVIYFSTYEPTLNHMAYFGDYF
jgi:hypothetical protein